MEFDMKEIREGIKEGLYENIGNGTGRSVYDIGNGIVAKNARNIKGVAQNLTEYDIYFRSHSTIFAKVYHLTNDGEILLMEKAKPLEDINTLLEYFHACCKKQLVYVDPIRYLSYRYKLIPADLCKPGSWGETEDGLVLIDYGFTTWVSKKFYY